MKESPAKETAPFKESLIRSEFKPRLYKFKNNPDFIVRKEPIENVMMGVGVANRQEAINTGKKFIKSKRR